MNNTRSKKYRIKSPMRFTMFIVIVMLLIGAGVTTILGFNNANSMTKRQYVQVEVQPGDTLWSIADQYMSTNIDPRESVYLICEVNNTSASQLQPGQTLQIPVKL